MVDGIRIDRLLPRTTAQLYDQGAFEELRGFTSAESLRLLVVESQGASMNQACSVDSSLLRAVRGRGLPFDLKYTRISTFVIVSNNDKLSAYAFYRESADHASGLSFCLLKLFLMENFFIFRKKKAFWFDFFLRNLKDGYGWRKLTIYGTQSCELLNDT